MDRHLFVERAVMEESAYGSRKEPAAADLLFCGGSMEKSPESTMEEDFWKADPVQSQSPRWRDHSVN